CARHLPRRRGPDRDRRPLLHGPARPAGRAVLHARVVRQVHALSRGDALDGADPREDRGRARGAVRARPAARRRLSDPRPRPLPPRRRGGDADRELRDQVPRRVPGARRPGRLPVQGLLDARARLRAGQPALAPSDRRGPRVTELVTLTIDGREVQVPKGTGLVETALAAGIEIPVFCYEPRLGPAVGACRMCLCDVEGLPKPMAACTMTAQDGMVVRTALTSEKAAEAQNATLEFLLVN